MSDFNLENKYESSNVTISNLSRGINVKDYATVADAISAIGSSSVDLYFPSGSYAVDADLTIPANVNLVMSNGAVFNVASGKVLTVNGGIDAGLYQIFSSASATPVAGNPIIDRIYLQWFGGKGRWSN